LEPIRRLADALGGVVAWSEVLGRYMLVSDDLTMTACWNHLATVERAEGLPGDPWDGTWFQEDYCEGPGQALIVNPKGEVKPCCGFASDLDQLTIGNIYTDSVEEVIANGRAHPVVVTRSWPATRRRCRGPRATTATSAGTSLQKVFSIRREVTLRIA
jgi:radical SAM protein with 4Fe4S-binding SPASM domain